MIQQMQKFFYLYEQDNIFASFIFRYSYTTVHVLFATHLFIGFSFVSHYNLRILEGRNESFSWRCEGEVEDITWSLSKGT